MSASFGRTGPMRPTQWLVGLIVAAMASLVGAAAAHAATFLPPKAVSPAEVLFPAYYSGTATGSDAAGNSVVALLHHDGSNPFVCCSQIRVVTRSAGGTFSAANRVSSAGRNAFEPRVAVNSKGAALVVWTETNASSQNIVRAIFRPAGGSFGTVQDLSGSGQSASAPDASVGDDGTAIVTWTRSNGTHQIVQATVKPAGGTLFGAVNDLSAVGQHASSPTVDIDSSGRAVLAWSRYDGANNIVQVVPRPAGGPFGAVQDLSAAGGSAYAPEVVINPSGHATAVWYRYNGSRYIVQSSERTSAGALFGVAQSLTPGTQDSYVPKVAVDRNGVAVATWYAFDPNNSTYVIQGAARNSGGFFGSPQTLSGPGASAFSPTVAMDPAGNALVIWGASSGGAGDGIQANRRPAGGSFGGPQDVAAASATTGFFSPSLAMDGQGNAIIAFDRYRSQSPDTYYSAFVAAYDAAGPELRSLNVPRSGTAGSPVAMSVNPFDRWTATTTTWSFGDGTSGTGASVRHTYSTPGPYTVTVTSRDTAGNATSTTRTITVASPPAPPAPPPPPAPPAPPAPPTKITFGMPFAFSKSTKKFTTFTLLQLKGFPSGSLIRVACKAPKGKKCPAKSYTKRNARGTVKLKKWTKKKLAAGTTLTVTVTKSGNYVGAVKTMTVRKKKRPTFSDRCLPPGAKKPTRCS